VWKGILGLVLLVALIVLAILAIASYFAFVFTMGLPPDAGKPS
jgi:hypothetical protein